MNVEESRIKGISVSPYFISGVTAMMFITFFARDDSSNSRTRKTFNNLPNKSTSVIKSLSKPPFPEIDGNSGLTEEPQIDTEEGIEKIQQ